MDNLDPPDKGFKVPTLIGKVGKLPRALNHIKLGSTKSKSDLIDIPSPSNVTETETDIRTSNDIYSDGIIDEDNKTSTPQCIETIKETNSVSCLPYKEPKWSDKPSDDDGPFSFEVLKSGVILETIRLESRAFWMFGRLEGCDIVMAHPTVSRYHAVLQYRPIDEDNRSKGWYVFDLGSTHGTFINKNRIPVKCYVPVKIGYMLRMGASTRNYILQGSTSDDEMDTHLTITDVIREKEAKIQAAKEYELAIQEQKELELKKKEDQGISWGMGEDADEETDLTENPFALTNNEELFLEDPKKTLRGFFEREGSELQYNVEEKGVGHYLCKIELPIDDQLGRPIVAECALKGKKKEVVVQCALEACRILDRAGVLRQASHEPRKRKQADSESDDDDDFLDRTGDVEKKRLRKAQQVQKQSCTYAELMEQNRTLLDRISELEAKLIGTKPKTKISVVDDQDALDQFMSGLGEEKLDKITIRKHKVEIHQLKIEHQKLQKLIKIAEPNRLPDLIIPDENAATSIQKKLMPLFGKRPTAKNRISIVSNTTGHIKPKLLNKVIVKKDISGDTKLDIKNTTEVTSSVKLYESKGKLTDASSSIDISAPVPSKTTIKENAIFVPIDESETLEENNDDEFNEEELKKKGKKRNRFRDRTKDDRSTAESEENIKELGEKYNTWVPPSGQSGDGRTQLNDKFGY